MLLLLLGLRRADRPLSNVSIPLFLLMGIFANLLDDGISISRACGAAVERERTGDVLGETTTSLMEKRTCFADRGCFGSLRLLRRLPTEVSDREDDRRRPSDRSLGKLAEKWRRKGSEVLLTMVEEGNVAEDDKLEEMSRGGWRSSEYFIVGRGFEVWAEPSRSGR